MNSNCIEITELKRLRKLALEKFDKINFTKNETLARYVFTKFQKGEDITYSILKRLPVGQAVLLPVVFGGAIVTTKLNTKVPNQILHTTKWTAGSTLTLHYHSDCTETVEVMEGKIRVFVEGQDYTLTVGETITISSGIVHQLTAIVPTELRVKYDKVV